jgi:chromosome segregation ATPase
MTRTATTAVPSAADLAETISALKTEIEELAEAIRQAEAQAAESAHDQAAYHVAEGRVRKLQEQVSPKEQRLERLRAAHGAAVARELDEEIDRCRQKYERLGRESEDFNEETARKQKAEEQRHAEAMAKLKSDLEEARQRVDSTRSSLACALKRKSTANAEEIANFVLLRAEARKKAAAVGMELDSAEEAYLAEDVAYNQACRDGTDEHNLGAYRERAERKRAHVEAVSARKQNHDDEIGRLTARLRDLGGDPEYHEF